MLLQCVYLCLLTVSVQKLPGIELRAYGKRGMIVSLRCDYAFFSKSERLQSAVYGRQEMPLYSKIMKKAAKQEKNCSPILYQCVTGDFYTIISEGEFTLPSAGSFIFKNKQLLYNEVNNNLDFEQRRHSYERNWHGNHYTVYSLLGNSFCG